MPPSAARKKPSLASVGAGEGALLVAEQQRFQHGFGHRGAVDRHERAGAARAAIVDEAAEHFLAGAGGAVYQHRDFAGGKPFGQREDREAFGIGGNRRAGQGGGRRAARRGWHRWQHRGSAAVSRSAAVAQDLGSGGALEATVRARGRLASGRAIAQHHCIGPAERGGDRRCALDQRGVAASQSIAEFKILHLLPLS